MRNTLATAFNRLKSLIKGPFYSIYRRRLERKARRWRKPQHVGIIMDGNRRFARHAGYANVSQGHSKGAEQLHEVLKWCWQFDVKVITVWAFSLDNFSRDPDELAGLFDLFEAKFREIVDHPSIHKYHVKVRYIGHYQRLPERLQRAIDAAEAATSHYDGITLNVAIAYGGREEITDAFRRHIEAQVSAGLDATQIAAQLEPHHIDRYLYTAGLPDPDLIIRTSGELRLSGFLLWQSVYSEYYFCDALWPAFRKIEFLRALRAFDQRKRRFGK
ncbi:MAG: polyprenyl diphosphate synthase [Planctomycetota bacterium]